MEDNLELLLLAKKGDENAKEKLVENNLGLVRFIAKRFTGRGYDLEDIFQIGCIGLIKSIDRFDMSYGVQFSTYSVPMISGEIKRFIRDSGAIKVSRSLKELNYKIEKYIEAKVKERGITPDISEIAEEFAVTKEEVVMAQEAGCQVESLDNIVIQNGQMDHSQKIVDSVMITELLNKLPENEKKLIVLRYYQEKTQSEIGSILNMSQVQISRMEKRAIEHLKEFAMD